MKRKDLMIVGAVAIVAAIFSIILSGVLFGSTKKNVVKVPKVEAINATFPSPKTDDTYNTFFNSNALNPTQLIQIGNNSNSNPFQGTGQ